VQLPVNTVIPPTRFSQGYFDSGRQVKEGWKQGRKAIIAFSIFLLQCVHPFFAEDPWQLPEFWNRSSLNGTEMRAADYRRI
jgi:hypothetical protein